jgi:hypothetical protein
MSRSHLSDGKATGFLVASSRLSASDMDDQLSTANRAELSKNQLHIVSNTTRITENNPSTKSSQSCRSALCSESNPDLQASKYCLNEADNHRLMMRSRRRRNEATDVSLQLRIRAAISVINIIQTEADRDDAFRFPFHFMFSPTRLSTEISS